MRIGKHASRALRALIAACAVVTPIACADAPRPIVEDPATGFALYRSGRIGPGDLQTLCDLGVEEILVLNGDGEGRECVFRETVCPGMAVRYNHAQNADLPVSVEFLTAFDAWIEEAQLEGKKIAFRCRHGWHRTGRLAAYYRLRFEGASSEEVTEEMHRIGSRMWLHPSLDEQVEAYADLLAGRPCSVEPRHCPTDNPDPGLDGGHFPSDACLPISSGAATVVD